MDEKEDSGLVFSIVGVLLAASCLAVHEWIEERQCARRAAETGAPGYQWAPGIGCKLQLAGRWTRV